MTRWRLLARTLAFHWRGNLAVLLGVAVGAAVLTGALLVGDSLRGSLRERSLEQLGWVDQALLGRRFFRQDLLPADAAEGLGPAILLRGAVHTEAGRQAGRVTILGVNNSFWLRGDVSYPGILPSVKGKGARFVRGGEGIDWQGNHALAVLDAAVAAELGVKPGDEVVLQLIKASGVPRETLLGRRGGSDVVGRVTVKVAALLPDDSPARLFSLIPSPAPPRNVYVPLGLLQEELGQPGKVNVLLARGGSDLDGQLHQRLTLDDWGLVVHDPETRATSLLAKLDRDSDGELSPAELKGRVAETFIRAADLNEDGGLSRHEVQRYYEKRNVITLESRQMLLGPSLERPALEAAADIPARASATLVYLANWITEKGPGPATVLSLVGPVTPFQPITTLALLGQWPAKKRTPYAIVAALSTYAPSPLGPFQPRDMEPLNPGEMVLAGWDRSPLPGKIGDMVDLTYFSPVEQGKLEERTARFVLKGVIPLTGVADDPDLTPEFPGITDKLTLDQWDPPFPYDNKRITKDDEEFWRQHRTTPKAYVSLREGQRLWGSRFGNWTSLRLTPSVVRGFKPPPLVDFAADYRQRLLAKLIPEEGGWVFEKVRERALTASGGGTDFGMLFLGFSFFLIAAALLLVGLLVRLNLDRRAAEVGLLLAAGFRAAAVRRLLLAEGVLLAALGALVGVAGAVVYARALIGYLNASWPGGIDQSFLRLHVTGSSLAIGYFSAVAVSVLTIAWAVRALRRAAPRALLAGETTDAAGAASSGPGPWTWRLLVGSLVVGIGLVAAGTRLQLPDQRAMTFFGGGALLLTAGLTAVWLWLRRPAPAAPSPHVAALGIRNAGRHPGRSLLTAGLLAAAAFLIVAVESFRRQPDGKFLTPEGGSGGFALVAESDVPIFEDLNEGLTPAPAPFLGRAELFDALERRFRRQTKDTTLTPEQRLTAAKAALAGVQIFPLRLQGGDDASCLNLYQAVRPRILGVPPALVDRGGFLFAATLPAPDDKPWRLLDAAADGTEQKPVPVFAEQNTVMWMLKSKLGGVLALPRDGAPPLHVRIVGLLQDSVFQSELLMSEANFLRLFPTHEGYNVFLVETPPGRNVDEVSRLLEAGLADWGFDAVGTAQRVAEYQAVVNTYLSTFQALGGLGLALGSLGLAVVLLRGVWERRGELALLRALGFRREALGWLVLAENGCLLLLGLGVGALAALVAVAPHVAGGGQISWLRLALLLGLVLIAGLASGAAALAATLRAPLLPALRRE